MADIDIEATIYVDGRSVGSAYGSGGTLRDAIHKVTSDLANVQLESDAEGDDR